eukprot:1195397-Prorocentrum_minimum.AAC.3
MYRRDAPFIWPKNVPQQVCCPAPDASAVLRQLSCCCVICEYFIVYYHGARVRGVLLLSDFANTDAHNCNPRARHTPHITTRSVANAQIVNSTSIYPDLP